MDDIEKEIIKLGGKDAGSKTDTYSKASDKGNQHISTNISEKNAHSVKSGDTSGTRSGRP